MSTIGRFQFLAFAALGMLVASSANAQRGGIGSSFGGGTNIVRLTTFEAVQKELGLNAEVIGKLTAMNAEAIATTQKAFQDAGIVAGSLFQNLSDEERQKIAAKVAEVSAKVQGEFNTKVKALVSADQYQRLGEIQLQANLRNLGPAALIAAALAAELKITDEQQKKLTDLRTEYNAKARELRAGGGFDQEASAKLRDERNAKALEVLTAEQKTKLETLKGKAFDLSQIGLGGRGRGRRGGGN